MSRHNMQIALRCFLFGLAMDLVACTDNSSSPAIPPKPQQFAAAAFENAPPPADPPRAQTLHKSFLVAELRGAPKAITIGPWTDSTAVHQSSTVTVAVLASWCPYSVELLEKTAENNLKMFDFVVFYESEFADAVDREVRHDKIKPAAGEKIKKQARRVGRFLVDPDVLKHELPYFVIKKDQFKVQVNSFPSIVDCDSYGCEVRGR
jgi:hypothetical protein